LKFQPDFLEGVNTISRQDRFGIWVAGRPHRGSVIVPWVGTLQVWSPTRYEELEPGHFEQLLAFEPEVVIFGSGERLRFVAAPMIRSLVERRIGVEVMDSAAACRTYNVLVSEKRAVLAALLFETPPASERT
jgi:uncharacterized protein